MGAKWQGIKETWRAAGQMADEINAVRDADRPNQTSSQAFESGIQALFTKTAIYAAAPFIGLAIMPDVIRAREMMQQQQRDINPETTVVHRPFRSDPDNKL